MCQLSQMAQPVTFITGRVSSREHPLICHIDTVKSFSGNLLMRCHECFRIGCVSDQLMHEDPVYAIPVSLMFSYKL